MHVTDVRKKVVFDLEIQATHIPGEPPALIAEVGRGVQLVYSPVVFQGVVRIRKGKFCSVDDVRWLKDDREDKSCHVMHQQNSNQHLPPEQRGQQKRDEVNISHIRQLRNDQYHPLTNN